MQSRTSRRLGARDRIFFVKDEEWHLITPQRLRPLFLGTHLGGIDVALQHLPGFVRIQSNFNRQPHQYIRIVDDQSVGK